MTRALLQNDLYFLLRYGCGRNDFDNDFLFDRCRQVQHTPDGCLDLWAREHYKSTIITFGQTIQDILNNPSITVGIFSHTRPIAKAFLRQIQRELESNALLKRLFSDILWENPRRDAPMWSLDGGLVVNRKTNPKEATVEAWGLVDGQPTSKHFDLLIYDDVVTRESVTTPEQIHKTTEAWELSLNLGARGGARRMIGTRYHFNDTWGEIMKRKSATPRIYEATINGEVDGEPRFLTKKDLMEKRRDMGPYTFACQMLQNPKADSIMGFKREWLRFVDKTVDNPQGMNVYMTVDSASAKKATSDYTAIWVIGLASDNNYYVLDMVRDRLSLTERADVVFNLHKRWKPTTIGYERYGMMADIEHIRDRQGRENYRFNIVELGGSQPKDDRIRRLVPLFEQGRIWFPKHLYKANYEHVQADLVYSFIEEEYVAFPVSNHDDMLDSLSRIVEDPLQATWPRQTHAMGNLTDQATTSNDGYNPWS